MTLDTAVLAVKWEMQSAHGAVYFPGAAAWSLM